MYCVERGESGWGKEAEERAQQMGSYRPELQEGCCQHSTALHLCCRGNTG